MVICYLDYEFRHMKLNSHLSPQVLLLYKVCLSVNRK